MILLEEEQTLAGHVEATKAEILHWLKMHQPLMTYASRADLVRFLDGLQADLEQEGYPGLLTRIVVFHRDPGVVEEVIRPRMAPGVGSLAAYKAPDCWLMLGARLPQIKAAALRAAGG